MTTFQSPYEQYRHRNGETCTIVEAITEPGPDIDEEVLPMFRIQFQDGEIIHAWPEELHPLPKEAEEYFDRTEREVAP